MSMPSLPLHVGDYITDTLDLSLEEHGAYLKLLMLSWKAGEPLDLNHTRLARMLGITTGKWKKLWPALEGFFEVRTIDGRDKIVSKKLEKIRETVLQRVEKNRENGARGGRPKQSDKSLKKKETDKANGSDLGSGVANPGDKPSGTLKEPNQNQNQYNPPTPPLETEVAEPSEPVGGGDDRDVGEPDTASGDQIDRIRIVVWRQAGLTEDQIATKRAAAATEGVRQVVGWLRAGLTETQIVEAVTRAYDAAETSGDPIRRPWPYLDQVMQGQLEEMATPSGDGSVTADEAEWNRWRMRVEGYRTNGFWMGTWGPEPGRPGCQAPAELTTGGVR